jgi:hypothetical protein
MSFAINAIRFIRKTCIFYMFFVFCALLVISCTLNMLDGDSVMDRHAMAQQTEKIPAFQDSYWTDKTVAAGNASSKLDERAVGPGEGVATLAVVLVNKAQSDISAIKGYLSLPPEFYAVETGNSGTAGSSNGLSPVQNTMDNNSRNNVGDTSPSSPSPDVSNISVASFDSVVRPGEEFTLYFDVYIKNNSRVGLHDATLDLVYSKVLTAGDISANDIPVSFRIPGKVILDIESKDQYLAAAETNNIGINIVNKGSADASDVVVTVSNNGDQTSDDLAAVSGDSAVGGLASSSSSSSSSTTTNNKENTEGNSSNNSSSSSSPSPQSPVSQSQSSGSAGAIASNSSIATIGTHTYTLGTIGAGKSVSINSLIYPATAAAETLQNLNVQVSYGSPVGNRDTANFDLGLIISAQPTESNFGISLGTPFTENQGNFSEIPGGNSSSSSLTNTGRSQLSNDNDNIVIAGNIEDLRLNIVKTIPSEVRDAVISINPSSDSVKILGPSRWSFETLRNNTIGLDTSIFVSEDLIGKPIQLTATIEYILNGIAKSESLNLGMYVDGKINIRAYEFEINTIGDEPNLVSNLLNEGNTDALFTTAELIPASEALSYLNQTGSNSISTDSSNGGNRTIPTLVKDYPPPQYLGDLAENSPLPVSLPLNIPNNTAAGDYPVFLRISYKDNLRNTHEMIVNSTVKYSPPAENSANNNGTLFGVISPLMLLFLVVVAIVVIVYLVIRRRRRRNKRKQKSRAMTGRPKFQPPVGTSLDSIMEEEKD